MKAHALRLTLASLLAVSVGAAEIVTHQPLTPRTIQIVPPSEPALVLDDPYHQVMLFTTSWLAGRFGALTGPSHPITTTVMTPAPAAESADVLRLGVPHDAWTVRSYGSRRDYGLSPNFPWTIAQAGFECVKLDEITTPRFEVVSDGVEPVAVRETWLLDAAPDLLAFEQELRPVGDSYASSSVAITLRVTNLGATPAAIGARLMLNPDIGISLGGNDGPFLALRPPDPPVEPLPHLEREFRAPTQREWDEYGFQRPSRMHWLYHLGGSLVGTSTLVPPATPPDLFQHSRGQDPFGDGLYFACFSYLLHEPPRPVANDFSAVDSAIAYIWGDTEDRARVLAPGETFEATTHVYAYIDYPLTCSVATPPVTECEGLRTGVLLDGSASAAIDGTPLAFRWSSIDPSVSFDDPTSERPIMLVSGPGRYPVHLTTEVGPYGGEADTTVEVVDTTPPQVRRISVTPSTLWPPNHRMVPVTVSVEAGDECDPAPVARLVSVASSEPDETRRGGDGSTTSDIRGAALGTPDFQLELRAERRGAGQRRTYTLSYEVTDASGNATRTSVDVVVPHDRRARPRR